MVVVRSSLTGCWRLLHGAVPFRNSFGPKALRVNPPKSENSKKDGVRRNSSGARRLRSPKAMWRLFLIWAAVVLKLVLPGSSFFSSLEQSESNSIMKELVHNTV